MNILGVDIPSWTVAVGTIIGAFFIGFGAGFGSAVAADLYKRFNKHSRKIVKVYKKRFISKIFAWGYARFLMVGVGGTLISMTILYMLTEYFHLYYIISFIIGTIAGSINNYLWSKYWVFNT